MNVFNTCQTLLSYSSVLLVIEWLSVLGKNQPYDLLPRYKSEIPPCYYLLASSRTPRWKLTFYRRSPLACERRSRESSLNSLDESFWSRSGLGYPPRELSSWAPCGRNFCQDTIPALSPDAHEGLHNLSFIRKGYYDSGWTWCGMDWWRGYWGTTSTHEYGWGLAPLFSLLLHIDNHHYTQQSILTLGFSLVRSPRFAYTQGVILGMVEYKVDDIHLVFSGRGLFVLFTIYVSSVEHHKRKQLYFCDHRLTRFTIVCLLHIFDCCPYNLLVSCFKSLSLCVVSFKLQSLYTQSVKVRPQL